MKTEQKHLVVFTTDRGQRHQQEVLDKTPSTLTVTMLRRPDKATLLAQLADAEYLISERAGVIDAEVIQNAPRLKLIQRLGSLTYDIDCQAAAKKGVAVCYWPIEMVIRVAEHVILQLLAVGKKLHEVEAVALAASSEWAQSRRTDEDTFAYNWSKRVDVNQLWQRTVGIIGFGEIGVEVTRRLQNWGCTLMYNKRSRLPENTEAEFGLTYADTRMVFEQSDYLVNLLPYYPNTDMMINQNVFSKMKDGAYLVSCGSGSVIDEAALTEAVRSGKLAGAALDTFEWEPIRADNPLVAAAKEGLNIFLTPHTAAGTRQTHALEPSRAQDYTNILNHLAGKPLLHRVV
jgi:phosphoglycerate dehydrogenase-like enzyme